jgi:hypothetical protein
MSSFAFLFFRDSWAAPDVMESLEHIVFLFLTPMFEFLVLIVETF